MGIPLPCTPTQVSAEELASILVKGKEKETSTKGVAAPKGQYDNPMGSSSSNKPGEEGGDMTKRKRQTKEEETNKDKPAKAPYPNRPKTTVQAVFISGLMRKDMKPAAQYNIYPTNLIGTNKLNIWHITNLPDWSSIPHTNSALLNTIATGAALAAASYNKEKVQIELRYEQPDRPFMKGKKKEIGFFITYKKCSALEGKDEAKGLGVAGKDEAKGWAGPMATSHGRNEKLYWQKAVPTTSASCHTFEQLVRIIYLHMQGDQYSVN
ncbi:uncharacterized protein ACA1_378090 [Acanthamoeba castellanii str. Neff]|uniref:Uncharacterized protein n=1 Tax=Acanthamoeba castellanii (strain ATCC 30010 / Neff) TaxID=1257118 RepID=L8GUB3_ACACF|nr:uncharacterized protein ACA1_378090 [Acanthamoeba castellanii str. Neff]ELR15691.1 hypothetical protein ACA1_378090 [Acanthamoeba castellanii str. Neff]